MDMDKVRKKYTDGGVNALTKKELKATLDTPTFSKEWTLVNERLCEIRHKESMILSIITIALVVISLCI